MNYEASPVAIAIFVLFVSVVLGISFYLGSKAKSAQGYFAAHGQIHWFVNGVAFAGDYLSAASFLGICGTIAFNGYDGFLYSIGFLAGWIVALFVIAEPLKRLGKYTFADALDKKFGSRGIKLSAAISTLVVSIFYLIPQMVGAGTLVKPLLGLPHSAGVIIVGAVVILVVVTAGMVSTTWVQFIKGTLLVLFCAGMTAAILNRGLEAPLPAREGFQPYTVDVVESPLGELRGQESIAATGDWKKSPYLRFRDPHTKLVSVWRKLERPATTAVSDPSRSLGQLVAKTQYKTVASDKKSTLINGLPEGNQPGQTKFQAVGQIHSIPGKKDGATGPIGPLAYLRTLQQSEIVIWQEDKTKLKDADGAATTVYYPTVRTGDDLLTPGSGSTFGGVRSDKFFKKLDFLSLMLALFCGTASLPHILIRYYTVKDQDSARKSTVVGIASIGFFYVLTLYLGLAAMTSGVLDPTDTNMSAPLLTRSFGELPFAIISAIAFTTVLGTVSGLIMAASGTVAHDLASNLMNWELTDHEKVRLAKISAVIVGVIAMALGIWFGKLNVGFLVVWAFNIAASANLPALIMLLFWKRTTRQGITAAILVGMLTSLAWILLSEQAYKDVYGFDITKTKSIIPFSQPAIVTVPLGFIVLIVVSLLTPKEKSSHRAPS